MIIYKYKVVLKKFNGKIIAPKNTDERENYWKLIGETEKIIEGETLNNGRVLVLFDSDLNQFGVENHNPIPNTLWIKKTDLEITSI